MYVLHRRPDYSFQSINSPQSLYIISSLISIMSLSLSRSIQPSQLHGVLGVYFFSHICTPEYNGKTLLFAVVVCLMHDLMRGGYISAVYSGRGERDSVRTGLDDCEAECLP